MHEKEFLATGVTTLKNRFDELTAEVENLALSSSKDDSKEFSAPDRVEEPEWVYEH